jgi:hypothetical protein
LPIPVKEFPSVAVPRPVTGIPFGSGDQPGDKAAMLALTVPALSPLSLAVLLALVLICGVHSLRRGV